MMIAKLQKSLMILVISLSCCFAALSSYAEDPPSDQNFVGTWKSNQALNGLSYQITFSANHDMSWIMYDNGSYYLTVNGTWYTQGSVIVLVTKDSQSVRTYLSFYGFDSSISNGDNDPPDRLKMAPQDTMLYFERVKNSV